MTNDVQERRGFRASDLSMLLGKKGSLKEFGILGALVVIVVAFQIATEGTTLSSNNLINIIPDHYQTHWPRPPCAHDGQPER